MTQDRDYITTMDPDYGLRITDEHIRKAQPFDEHGPDYLRWPDHLWRDKAKGIPNEEIEKNAYHIRYLADIMREKRTLLADHHWCTDYPVSAISGKIQAGRGHERLIPPKVSQAVRITPKIEVNFLFHQGLRQNSGGDQRAVSNERSRENGPAWSGTARSLMRAA